MAIVCLAIPGKLSRSFQSGVRVHLSPRPSFTRSVETSISSTMGAEQSRPKDICSETLADLEPLRRHVLHCGSAWIEFTKKWGHLEPLYVITGWVESSPPSQNEAMPCSRAGLAPREPWEDQCIFLRGYMIQERRIPHSNPVFPAIARYPAMKRSLMRKFWSLFTSFFAFLRDTVTSPPSHDPLSLSAQGLHPPDESPSVKPLPRNNGVSSSVLDFESK